MRRAQNGFSLVELMIGSVVGLIVIGAAASLFLSGSRSYRLQHQLTRLQDELNFALTQLGEDLEMAGHWAQLHDPTRIQRHAGLSVANDCGAAGAAWVYADLSALAITDNAAPAAARANHQCLDLADVRAGADVIAIKRVLGGAAGTHLDASALAAGRVYLRAGDLSLDHGRPTGLLYMRGATVAGPPAAPYRDWEYLAAVYYVSAGAAAEEPALCRMSLRASGVQPRFERECLATGVEDLQIEVGIDTDEDGVANHFTSAAGPGDLARAVAVRLYLLARSERPEPGYVNTKTYRIGNAADRSFTGAEARYYRKTLTSQVVLRNPRALQGVAYQ